MEIKVVLAVLPYLKPYHVYYLEHIYTSIDLQPRPVIYPEYRETAGKNIFQWLNIAVYI